MINNNRWIPLMEFCRIYSAKPSTIRKYCESKQLASRKMGPRNGWYIDMWEWAALQDRLGVYQDEVTKYEMKDTSKLTEGQLYEIGVTIKNELDKDIDEED